MSPPIHHKSMSSSSIAIGIDLGTTTSCVSILRCDPDNPGTDPIVINNLNVPPTRLPWMIYKKNVVLVFIGKVDYSIVCLLLQGQ